MKRDEPYNPNIKSQSSPDELRFRSAHSFDHEAIVQLMSERNPHLKLDEVKMMSHREISWSESDPYYCLYVSTLDSLVVGLCRFWHSSILAEGKRIFTSPDGWYAMGLIVSPEHRRRNISTFMSQNRCELLRNMGVTKIYSLVDDRNLTSIRMHEKFGFKIEDRAEGFLHIKFEAGFGTLFRLDL